MAILGWMRRRRRHGDGTVSDTALSEREREGLIREYVATANDGAVSNVGIISGLAVADRCGRGPRGARPRVR